MKNKNKSPHFLRKSQIWKKLIEKIILIKNKLAHFKILCLINDKCLKKRIYINKGKMKI